MTVTPEQKTLIDDTYGVYMHGNRVRINLLLPPEVAVEVIGKAGHENVAHWVKRKISHMVSNNNPENDPVAMLGDKVSQLEVKLDRLLSHVVGD